MTRNIDLDAATTMAEDALELTAVEARAAKLNNLGPLYRWNFEATDDRHHLPRKSNRPCREAVARVSEDGPERLDHRNTLLMLLTDRFTVEKSGNDLLREANS